MYSFFKVFLTLLMAFEVAGFTQGQSSEEADKAEIRNIVSSYQEAYNQQDAAKLTADWTSDAVYINPVTGDSAEGKEAIEKLFREKFAQGGKRHLEITVKSIDFPNADEAIEKGVMHVTIDDQPMQQLAYQTEYVRRDGKWLVKAIGEIELQEPFSNFEQLKELTWLLGKWEDFDDHIDITFDTQWDKHKNFITQHFKLKIYGQDDIEGKQIIAWDSVKNIIRSWVFDSDGGFGEGTWEKVDKSWYATMHFTLGDSRVASSINIYTPLNDHSYTFASVEREVDGEILPDMDPVTVERIE